MTSYTPTMSESTDVTRLLEEAAEGKGYAAEELLPLVYDQLRKIAQQRMNTERTDHTLQATALVHEAYVRLVGASNVRWANRAHFYVAAAEAMRRILIEHARARGRVKRGGQDGKPAKREPLNVVDLAIDGDPEQIESLNDALVQLEKEDTELAMIVRLRFFAGLSVEDTASAMEMSVATVKRRWAYARARLALAMEEVSE